MVKRKPFLNLSWSLYINAFQFIPLISPLQAPALVALLVAFWFPAPSSPTLARLVWRTLCLGAVVTGGDGVRLTHDANAGSVAAEAHSSATSAIDAFRWTTIMKYYHCLLPQCHLWFLFMYLPIYFLNPQYVVQFLIHVTWLILHIWNIAPQISWDTPVVFALHIKFGVECLIVV